MENSVHNAQPVLPGSEPPRDSEIEQVRIELQALDPDGRRFAAAIRRTFDMLLDGRNTGRFRWEQLFKTEKTHCGTLVEINLQREFGFDGGQSMDYSVTGIDVDCKYSQAMWHWTIPPEAIGHICLLVWADDQAGIWSAGLARITDDILNQGRNRDGKSTIRAAKRGRITWLHRDATLPENVLLRLPQSDIDAIFGQSSGQARVNELFRRAQGRIISRATIATVAQQEDYMKRVRGNGGARTHLRPEGIIVLGQYSSDAQLAGALGVPVPGRGDSISVRLARVDLSFPDVPVVEINGAQWRVARPEDPVQPAPTLPKR
ncbi:restriction endonuclease [Mangrovactinospora gilvigrisea]|uniref:Restriction endonuclease n=1 Tax=Mangrovactinospora gilvigrisea TaxID=1428644 RepID=A0A1J7C9W4_9ACTN|nr:NaeI family type II restriction endonuclease [Mangrovactinospora gilvigrisea]OIV38308.1 restriction endonuclease [Mangrovactinospora gilvigrisea]